MKKLTLSLFVALSLILFSCGGNSESQSSEKMTGVTEAVTPANLIGEWECVDITNGVNHMKSIAKMQPHIIFNDKNEVLAKMKLADGSFAAQKIGSYKIENGKVVSKLYEKNPYMEDNQLIIEDTSADNKQIYKKLK